MLSVPLVKTETITLFCCTLERINCCSFISWSRFDPRSYIRDFPGLGSELLKHELMQLIITQHIFGIWWFYYNHIRKKYDKTLKISYFYCVIIIISENCFKRSILYLFKEKFVYDSLSIKNLTLLFLLYFFYMDIYYLPMVLNPSKIDWRVLFLFFIIGQVLYKNY